MRSLLRQRRLSDIEVASGDICHRLVRDLSTLDGLKSVAVFSAHGPEVKLHSLHQLLPHLDLLYPLCHKGGVLSFHHVSDPAELIPGTLGILEPQPEIHREVAVPDIEVFICPGLMFGCDHSRLGHGGGFYDRALHKKSQKAITIGVAMQIQIVKSVPHDSHDIHLDYVLTEEGYVGESL